MSAPDPLGGLGGGAGGPAAPPPRHPEPRPDPPPPEAESARARFHKVRRSAPGTVALLGALGLAFVIQSWAGDWDTRDTLSLFRLGALNWAAVEGGDWWRLGSYAFLHIGPQHFLLNSWALWLFMRPIEGTYGPAGSLGLFAASALAGGAASAVWARAGGSPMVLAAGASGGIAGLFGARIGVLLRLRNRAPPEALRAEWRALLINLALNGLLAWQAATGGLPLDNAAHLGGLLAGAFLAFVAPIPALPKTPLHRAAGLFLLLSAFTLAGMEGAAAARAIRPHTRTLRGPGLTAQAPWMLVPAPGAPGVAVLPGEDLLFAEVLRLDEPLSIQPGADVLQLGNRTWLRERGPDRDRVRAWVVLEAADGAGKIHVGVRCRDAACKGLADQAAEQLAATVQLVR